MITPQDFLNNGIAVIPVIYRDKRPALSTWEPYKTILPKLADLDKWFSKPANYGVVMGWQDLLVLDFDDLNEYQKWRVWCSKTGGVMTVVAESAFKVLTSRGVHVYVRLPGERNKKIGKIDIKANGYVIGPGSVHPTGKIYQPFNEILCFPRVNRLADLLPAELLATHTEQTGAVRDPVRARPQPLPNLDPWVRAMAPGTTQNSGLIDRIHAELKILDFFPQSTPTSADHRWWVTRCPFHDDKSPSFWIDSRDQVCGCFAGCTDRPMDVINLYSRLYGISNLDAIRLLAGGMG